MILGCPNCYMIMLFDEHKNGTSAYCDFCDHDFRVSKATRTMSEPAPKDPSAEFASKYCYGPMMISEWKPGQPFEPLDAEMIEDLKGLDSLYDEDEDEDGDGSEAKPGVISAAAQEFKGLFRPGIKLVGMPQKGYPRIWYNRIGGHPDLPSRLAWPTLDGQPLDFLAQLNVQGMRSNDCLNLIPPKITMLYFFLDLSEKWYERFEDPRTWRVLALKEKEDKEPRYSHPGLDLTRRLRGYDCQHAAFLTLPQPGTPVVNALKLDDAAEGRYGELHEQFDMKLDAHAIPDHRVLGYPQPEQGDVGEECAERVPGTRPEEWQLLLQLDSDHRNGMCWGDEGHLYFMIRNKDLKAARFDKVQLIIQHG